MTVGQWPSRPRTEGPRQGSGTGTERSGSRKPAGWPAGRPGWTAPQGNAGASRRSPPPSRGRPVSWPRRGGEGSAGASTAPAPSRTAGSRQADPHPCLPLGSTWLRPYAPPHRFASEFCSTSVAGALPPSSSRPRQGRPQAFEPLSLSRGGRPQLASVPSHTSASTVSRTVLRPVVSTFPLSLDEKPPPHPHVIYRSWETGFVLLLTRFTSCMRFSSLAERRGRGRRGTAAGTHAPTANALGARRWLRGALCFPCFLLSSRRRASR